MGHLPISVCLLGESPEKYQGNIIGQLWENPMAYLLDMEVSLGESMNRSTDKAKIRVPGSSGNFRWIDQSNLEIWNLFFPTLLVINVTIGNL